MTLPASPHERTLYLCAAPPSPTALAILERLEAGEAPGAALLCVAPEPLRAAAEALPARSPRFACAAERTARGIC
ncbi:MAG: hypothetical protein LBR16_06950, partial [Treponema sp.]|nr:hypothetical protein [Treponema sp.]